ncbi:hypothetical protein E6W39_11925 [Kitasatospora acidiphila]|uniref:Glycosyl hydrolase family 30 TIM-barrel domain-containing protein n=1 Tax=Kitasatospora acidiphila TaxID=2567942 RepID=A0A540W1D3_9ACTN|nr:hypothetical protein E6W39_11925 [Kitasatospora acidiphila]
MNKLFNRSAGGIGLSLMRVPMGSSDYTATPPTYSYDDNNNVADPTLAHFSITHDQAYTIPILQQAQSLNPSMKLLANDWSPPAWMKSNDSMLGANGQGAPAGTLNSDDYGPARPVLRQIPYETARIRFWQRLHPRAWRHSAWSDHRGQLPTIEGTLIRLDVDHLPSGGTPKPVWLWFSDPTPADADTDTAWHAFLRRFDLEHTFRFLKQTLGWTRPRLREPAAADRWTCLVLAAHTQLRLARPLSADLRRPWERPQPPERLTPTRVRRGFRNIRTTLPCPTAVARPSRPGPGR